MKPQTQSLFSLSAENDGVCVLGGGVKQSSKHPIEGLHCKMFITGTYGYFPQSLMCTVKSSAPKWKSSFKPIDDPDDSDLQDER